MAHCSPIFPETSCVDTENLFSPEQEEFFYNNQKNTDLLILIKMQNGTGYYSITF